MIEKSLSILGSVVRLTIACAFLWFCWQDLDRTHALAEFEALPEFDYWKEAGQLLDQERFSEALFVVDAGIEALPEKKDSLMVLRQRIEVEQKSWMFRFQQLGQGALTGTGKSLEALTGAVVADLFVFGDVRDLVVQAGRKLRGEETDPVIVALSAGGILLTVSPAVDLGGALLKFARRIGAMSESFAKNLLKVFQDAVAKRNADELVQISTDMETLAAKARPAGAMTIFKNVDDAAELRRAAQFTEQPGGTFALWLSGRNGLGWLRSGTPDAGALLIKASKRGREGLDYLFSKSHIMLKPHPLLGLIKGFWKGNIPEMLYLLGQKYATLLLGLAFGWVAFEAVLLLGRIVA